MFLAADQWSKRLVWTHVAHTSVRCGPVLRIRRVITRKQMYERSTARAALVLLWLIDFKVRAFTADSSSLLDACEEASATPGVTVFLAEKALGSERNNFDGWAGMVIQVRSNPITITQLGRWSVLGNAMTHVVKIVDPGQNNAEVGSATVPVGPPGAFSFASVSTSPAPTLLANRLYYIVSFESSGGDRFHDFPTAVEPIGEPMNLHVANVVAGVYSSLAMPNDFTLIGMKNQTYGPLNFRY